MIGLEDVVADAAVAAPTESVVAVPEPVFVS
jgi:hypothetical protein